MTLNRPTLRVLRGRYGPLGRTASVAVLEDLYEVERALMLSGELGHSSMAWLEAKHASLKRKHRSERAFIAVAMNDLCTAIAYESQSWKRLERCLLMTLTSTRRPLMRDSLYMMAAECLNHSRGRRLEPMLRGPGLRYMKARAPSAMLARYERLLEGAATTSAVGQRGR